jgi:hypothetical protein
MEHQLHIIPMSPPMYMSAGKVAGVSEIPKPNHPRVSFNRNLDFRAKKEGLLADMLKEMEELSAAIIQLM